MAEHWLQVISVKQQNTVNDYLGVPHFMEIGSKVKESFGFEFSPNMSKYSKPAALTLGSGATNQPESCLRQPRVQKLSYVFWSHTTLLQRLSATWREAGTKFSVVLEQTVKRLVNFIHSKMFKNTIKSILHVGFRPATLYCYFSNSQLTKMLYLFNFLVIIINMYKPDKTYWLR